MPYSSNAFENEDSKEDTTTSGEGTEIGLFRKKTSKKPKALGNFTHYMYIAVKHILIHCYGLGRISPVPNVTELWDIEQPPHEEPREVSTFKDRQTSNKNMTAASVPQMDMTDFE